MRTLFILPLSAAFLSGCLTSQENPNYEHSTTYRGDQVEQNQYANAVPAAPAPISYQPSAVSYESVPVQPIPQYANSVSTTVMATAPTDSAFGQGEVNGTPGFMAMQSANQGGATQAVAETLPPAEYVSTAPLGGAGTPIAYDYSRNLITADAVTTSQKIPDTVKVLGGAGQNYTVQQGDTVYSLSRKTCVGVNVIQSMNGLNTDYAIKIGQALTLPASVC